MLGRRKLHTRLTKKGTVDTDAGIQSKYTIDKLATFNYLFHCSIQFTSVITTTESLH